MPRRLAASPPRPIDKTPTATTHQATTQQHRVHRRHGAASVHRRDGTAHRRRIHGRGVGPERRHRISPPQPSSATRRSTPGRRVVPSSVELPFTATESWGPAENWSDWAYASGRDRSPADEASLRERRRLRRPRAAGGSWPVQPLLRRSIEEGHSDRGGAVVPQGRGTHGPRRWG